MAMREECKHFQSRTYNTGDTARFCSLDLAPEAPWKCPDGCQKYERRLADVAWRHGSLVPRPVGDAPGDSDANIAELLDAAEDVVNNAVDDALSELHVESKKRRIFKWKSKD